MNIIDISTDILTAKVFPGDPEPKIQTLNRIGRGDDYNLSAIYACLHTGTHIDAPSHFIEDGDTVTDYELETFIGPCKVIELTGGIITGDVVDRYFPRDCKKLLIKSNGKAVFMEGAAEDTANLGYELIGIDGLTVGSEEDDGRIHRTFLSHDTVLLEGLDLSCVQSGDYFLFAPPVKISGQEASFARAVLISDYIFWGGKG